MKYWMIILTIIGLIIFCGCEKDTNELPPEIMGEVVENVTEYKGMTMIEKSGYTNVFSSEKISFQYDFLYARETHMHDIFTLDDRIYLTAERSIKEDDSYYEQLYLVSYNSDGSDMTSFPFTPVVPGAFVAYMWCDSKYNQILIEELDYEYTLYKKTKDGEIIFSIPLEAKDISMMVIGENDNIYIGMNYEVLIYSSDGKLLCVIELDHRLSHISSAHGKRPILKLSGGGYKYINLDEKTLEDIEMPITDDIDYIENNIIYGEGYDYYYYNPDGLFGYDIATNELTEILDWISSDINIKLIRSFTILSPEKMAMVNGEFENSKLYLLNHIPDDELVPKTIITLGWVGASDDQYLNEVVTYFNKTNPEYRLVPINYYLADYVDTPYQKLNNAVAAGKAPDILYTNTYMSLLPYIKQDMFVDLNTYLDKEPEFKNDLLPFAREGAQFNNKLPQLITAFTTRTLTTKSKNIPKGELLSIEKLLEIYKSLPDDVELFDNTNKNSIQSIFIYNIIPECVDYEKGTCNFDIPAMRYFLELFKSLADSDYKSSYLGDEMYDKVAADELYFVESAIYDFMYYFSYVTRPFMPEEPNIVGYPSVDGSKRNDFINGMRFSILNTSNEKDIAWKFIKSCLSPDFYRNGNEFTSWVTLSTKSGINYKVSEITRGGREYMYQPRKFAPGGFTATNDPTINFEETRGPGVLFKTEDLVNQYMTYVESLDNYTYYDEKLLNIINEEVSTYVGSNKSIEDTIKAIQSRAAIYMSETWS